MCNCNIKLLPTWNHTLCCKCGEILEWEKVEIKEYENGDVTANWVFLCKNIPTQQEIKDRKPTMIKEWIDIHFDKWETFNCPVINKITQDEIKKKIKELQKESTRIYQHTYYLNVTKEKRRRQSRINKLNLPN